MVFFIGTFGLNFPIFLSTMCVTVFHKGCASTVFSRRSWASGRTPGRSSLDAVESSLSHVLVARPSWPGPRSRLHAEHSFSSPSRSSSSGCRANLHDEAPTARCSWGRAAMRGRVVAIFLATPSAHAVGAPLVGWVADRFAAMGARPRCAGGIAAASWVSLPGEVSSTRGLAHRRRRLRLDMKEA